MSPFYMLYLILLFFFFIYRIYVRNYFTLNMPRRHTRCVLVYASISAYCNSVNYDTQTARACVYIFAAALCVGVYSAV